MTEKFELLTVQDIEAMPDPIEVKMMIGLRGEQGSGKTTILRTIQQVLASEWTVIRDGTMEINGDEFAIFTLQSKFKTRKERT